MAYKILIKFNLFIIICQSTILAAYSQHPYYDISKLIIKENAIRFDTINTNIYNLLTPYQIIMIGEIHGTNEPIQFLEDLVEYYTKRKDSILVGFEIPTEQMSSFIKHRNSKSILSSEFFKSPSGDGRASYSWYKAINKLNTNKYVRIFFFCNSSDIVGNADSIMYLNIKYNIQSNPGWKVVTISGGMHIRLNRQNGQPTVATFLIEDSELSLNNQVCVLSHEFKSGETLWNDFPEIESPFSKVGYDKYFYLYPKGSQVDYSGYIYTEKLTKSDSAIRYVKLKK